VQPVLVVQICSRHARTITWGEHSQLHVMFSVDNSFTTWKLFSFAIFPLSIFVKITYHFIIYYLLLLLLLLFFATLIRSGVNENKFEIRKRRKESWEPTSISWTCFFFNSFFLWKFRKILYHFFCMPLYCSRYMNETWNLTVEKSQESHTTKPKSNVYTVAIFSSVLKCTRNFSEASNYNEYQILTRTKFSRVPNYSAYQTIAVSIFSERPPKR